LKCEQANEYRRNTRRAQPRRFFRRKKSNWTDANKAIALRLLAEGRMTAVGQAALPEDMRR
jgi:hypothetical protein